MAGRTLDDLKNFVGGMTILLVDDSPFVRNLAKKILELMGAKRVLEAGDGEAAWAVVQGEDLGLIISDWKMPKSSGLDLLQKVRSGEKGQDTPFVMMSAEAEKEMVISSIRLGVTDVLIKPVDEKKLIKAILKVMP
jgi:two-component system chemotaxis response regulator CheY